MRTEHSLDDMTFAELAEDAIEHHRAHVARPQWFDARDRPLPTNDWLRLCAQAKEARLTSERKDRARRLRVVIEEVMQ